MGRQSSRTSVSVDRMGVHGRVHKEWSMDVMRSRSLVAFLGILILLTVLIPAFFGFEFNNVNTGIYTITAGNIIPGNGLVISGQTTDAVSVQLNSSGGPLFLIVGLFISLIIIIVVVVIYLLRRRKKRKENEALYSEQDGVQEK